MIRKDDSHKFGGNCNKCQTWKMQSKLNRMRKIIDQLHIIFGNVLWWWQCFYFFYYAIVPFLRVSSSFQTHHLGLTSMRASASYSFEGLVAMATCTFMLWTGTGVSAIGCESRFSCVGWNYCNTQAHLACLIASKLS